MKQLFFYRLTLGLVFFCNMSMLSAQNKIIQQQGCVMNKIPTNWTLYISDRCPFCAKVTAFLKEHNVTVATVDAWSDPAKEQQLLEWTGRRTVPYLRMGDTGMHESDDIIARIKQEAGL